MGCLVSIACVLGLLAAEVDTKFVQLHPASEDASQLQRSPEQKRAVVLIHGLKVHPIRAEPVKAAQFHSWQQLGAVMVKVLGQDADVFAFAYSQNAAVTEIAEMPGLINSIQRLREMGYAEIVLVGHSAGGLIARQLVEDRPDAGVTKVVQVCAPNHGAGMARLAPLVRKEQELFVESLSKEARRQFHQSRTDKRIPDSVQFVCVVGDLLDEFAGDAFVKKGDLLVSDESQWPEELREQGIPAVQIRTTHWGIRSRKVAEKLAELVRDDQPRCSPEAIAKLKKEIFGK